MILVRYVALAALVVWIAGVAAIVGGGCTFRRADLIGYICAAVIVISLFLMKFVGPPPSGFIARVVLAVLMAGAAHYSFRITQLVLGAVLLTWYARE